MLPYSVIITHRGKKRKLQGFEKLAELELTIQFLKEECPYISIHLINHKYGTPKPEGQQVRGKLWCPYCGAWRTFVRWGDYRKCSVCHVSTEEFQTKTANDLWPKMFDEEGKLKKKRNRKRG